MIHPLVIRIGQIGSLVSAAAFATPDSQNETTTYIIRGAIAIGLLAITYLLKEVAGDVKETKKLAIEHDALLQMHNLMFEQWVENLGDGDLENPGRRETDKLLRSLIEAKKRRK